MKTKIDTLFIVEVIPVFLIIMFILYTKSMVQLSYSSLGKLVAVCLIVGYTIFDPLYGLVMCMMIILYYQLDYVENMESINPDDGIWTAMGNMGASPYTQKQNSFNNIVLNEDGRFMGDDMLDPTTSSIDQSTEGMTTNDAISDPDNSTELFRQKYCRTNQLYYKEYPVKPDMAQHIFPDLVFKYEPCNPCNKTCTISFANSKIDTESAMVLPKSSNDFFYDSWKDLFGKSFNFIPTLDSTHIVDTFSLLRYSPFM